MILHVTVHQLEGKLISEAWALPAGGGKAMKYEKGNWQVRRACCRSGMCFECKERGTHGKPPPVLTIQGDGYSEGYAKFVAENWQTYGAIAEPMPERITPQVARSSLGFKRR